MDVPISVAFLIIIAIAVATGFYFAYVAKFSPSSVTLPVTAKLPAGNLVYKVGNTFFIPVRFSKADNSPPIGVCAIDINYMDSSNRIRVEKVTLALSPTSYVNSGSFSVGTVSLSQAVLYKSMDVTLSVAFNGPNYQLNSIVFYYCRYGVSTKPEWSETLLIPEVALTP